VENFPRLCSNVCLCLLLECIGVAAVIITSKCSGSFCHVKCALILCLCPFQHLFAMTSLNWRSSYCKTGWGVHCCASVCRKDSITFVMFSKALNLIIHRLSLSYYLWTVLMTPLVERCSEKPKKPFFSFHLPINSCSLHRKFFICCSGQYLL
jgi:hypothetical protein